MLYTLCLQRVTLLVHKRHRIDVNRVLRLHRQIACNIVKRLIPTGEVITLYFRCRRCCGCIPFFYGLGLDRHVVFIDERHRIGLRNNLKRTRLGQRHICASGLQHLACEGIVRIRLHAGDRHRHISVMRHTTACLNRNRQRHSAVLIFSADTTRRTARIFLFLLRFQLIPVHQSLFAGRRNLKHRLTFVTTFLVYNESIGLRVLQR